MKVPRAVQYVRLPASGFFLCGLRILSKLLISGQVIFSSTLTTQMMCQYVDFLVFEGWKGAVLQPTMREQKGSVRGQGRGAAILKIPVTAEKIFVSPCLTLWTSLQQLGQPSRSGVISNSGLGLPGLVEFLSQKRVLAFVSYDSLLFLKFWQP